MKKISRRMGILAGIVICIFLGIFSGRKILMVMGEEKPTITFGEFSKKRTIEDSVMLIGTHLIHIQSMTDALYEMALKSASEAEQSQIYYKSELADGAWFDITDALGLADISEEGIIVDPDSLKDLQLEYYTFKDGITRSAVTRNPINIFNISEPYDLYQMEELEQLRQQFDHQFDEKDTGVKGYYYEQLKEFFEQDVKNKVTEECDELLDGLQDMYISLLQDEEKELAEIVLKIMEKIDARRRVEVLYTLSQKENHLLNKLQEVCTGSLYSKKDYLLKIETDTEESTEEETTEEETTEEETTEEEGNYEYEEEQFVENSGVLEAIAGCLQNCQTSYTEKYGNSLEKGSTVIQNLEYEKTMSILGKVGIGGEDLLREIQLLYNIQDNLVKQKEEELDMIESQLLPDAEQKYKSGLSGGVGKSYRLAVSNGVSQAAKEQTLEQQKTELNTVLNELEFIINAQIKRQDPKEALEGLYDRLDSIQGLKSRVKKDAFLTKATESIEEYRIWLMERARAIIAENKELASEMDRLEEQKEEITMELQQALDDNDLALAKKKQAMLDLIDEQITAEELKLTDIMEDPDSSEGEKAQAQNQAGEFSALNNVNQIKQEALLALAEGEEDIQDQLEALTELGAQNALNEIADAARETGKEEVADQANKAAKESENSSLYGITELNDNSMDELRVMQQIEEFFGAAFEDMDGMRQAEILVVLDWLIEDGYGFLEDLFLRYFEAAGENLPAYDKLKRQDKEYAAMMTLASLLDYRYVFENSGKEVTISKGSKAYKVKANSKTMECYPKKQQTLSTNVLYQNDLYLSKEDALTHFGCRVEYLEKTDKGICLTEKMHKEAVDFYEILQQGEE